MTMWVTKLELIIKEYFYFTWGKYSYFVYLTVYNTNKMNYYFLIVVNTALTCLHIDIHIFILSFFLRLFIYLFDREIERDHR